MTRPSERLHPDLQSGMRLDDFDGLEAQWVLIDRNNPFISQDCPRRVVQFAKIGSDGNGRT